MRFPRGGSPWGFGGFGRARRGGASAQFCPELGEEVAYSKCLDCPQFGVWEDGDSARCRYECEELRQQGFYAKTEEEWLDCMERLDPETWRKVMEEKRNAERVQEEMEAELREMRARGRPDDTEEGPEERGAEEPADDDGDDEEPAWW